jgi:hypothetical protein
MQWELGDPRDSWRHTGERPPLASVRNSDIAVKPNAPRSYRTPQATVAAFWYVAALDDPDYLARWLAQHPADAPHLHEIWGRK